MKLAQSNSVSIDSSGSSTSSRKRRRVTHPLTVSNCCTFVSILTPCVCVCVCVHVCVHARVRGVCVCVHMCIRGVCVRVCTCACYSDTQSLVASVHDVLDDGFHPNERYKTCIRVD